MAERQFETWIVSDAERQWQRRSTDTPPRSASPNLALDGTRRQRWEGFGGAFNELGWIALRKVDADARAQALRALFHPTEGCRFNFCRIPIGASDYAERWYSPNETDGDYEMRHFSLDRDRLHLIPYVKAAQSLRREMKFFASPWSPPTWMKDPPVYNYGTLRWTPENLRAYALYFQKFIEGYAAEGIPISQLHVQNEPHSDQKFPSCLWTGERFREFIRDYLGPHFEQHRVNCDIWLGTLERADFDDMANLVLSDERARHFIKGVGYQWGGRPAVRRTSEAWPDVALMQTENECGDGTNSWEFAAHVFELLRDYIGSGVSAYVYWNMVLEPGGRSSWGWRQNSMICAGGDTHSVTYNPEFYVMQHLAHFVEPGATVLGLKGPLTWNALAFENPDGKLVLVVHNPMTDARVITFERAGERYSAELTPKSYNTFVL